MLAVIACITKSETDITLVLDKARGANHKSIVAESLAIIVKVLVHAGRFDEARAIVGNKKRGIVGEMQGLDPYWRAEAAIYLACLSGESDDRAEAGTDIDRIRNKGLREGARTDLASGRDQHINLPGNPFMALAVIADALKDGKGPYNSAYLNGQIDTIISTIFLSHLG